MREPVTERGMATRQRLVEAAEQVFGTEGFHAATIVEITRVAGVGLGTFYEYFDSKESLFKALVRHMSHELRRAIATEVAGLSDRLAQERVGFETFFRFALRHKNLYRIVLECQFVDEELYRWYYQRLADGYRRGLRAAIAQGQVRSCEVETVVYALLGIAQMLGMRWVLCENRVPPPEALEELSVIIARILAPEPKA